MLYRQMGIQLPRDAFLQANISEAVPIHEKDIRPGDLLFFGKIPPHIDHAGLALGQRLFIHAHAGNYEEFPGIMISNLETQNWSQHLRTIRRVSSLAPRRFDDTLLGSSFFAKDCLTNNPGYMLNHKEKIRRVV